MKRSKKKSEKPKEKKGIHHYSRVEWIGGFILAAIIGGILYLFSPGASHFSYDGYTFPKMPSTFKETKKQTSVSDGNPAVFYSVSQPLGQVETDIINTCKTSNFASYQGFSSYTGTTVGYNYQCHDKNNTWNFYVTQASSGSNDWTVEVDSLGPPTCSNVNLSVEGLASNCSQ